MHYRELRHLPTSRFFHVNLFKFLQLLLNRRGSYMKTTMMLVLATLTFVSAETVTAQTYASSLNAKRVQAIKKNQYASYARTSASLRSRSLAHTRRVSAAGNPTLTGTNQLYHARLANQRRISQAGTNKWGNSSSGGSFTSAYSKNSVNRARRLKSRIPARPTLRTQPKTFKTPAFSTIR